MTQTITRTTCLLLCMGLAHALCCTRPVTAQEANAVTPNVNQINALKAQELALIEKLVEDFPQRTDPLVLLGNTLYRHGNGSRALEVPLQGSPRQDRPANALYRNNGDWTFTDVTAQAGVGDTGFGLGVAVGDYNNDGGLDIYLNNYGPNVLYRNNGDGSFTNVSQSAGVAAHAGWGMGLVAADYDSDGDTDVLIANDVAENFLFENNGTGRFEEVALTSGFAYDGFADEQGSMGVDCGDFNNDGRLDFFMTSYQGQLAVLYKNLGQGMFQDVSMQTGAGTGTLAQVTWGTGLVDFDNDGDRDIFIACGHLQDRMESYDPAATYRQGNILLLNTGNERFQDISAQAGSGLRAKLSSRAAGFDDLDNDGDVDIVILNSREAPTVLRNDSNNKHHWIQISLQARKTNRHGVGARVKVVAGDLTQIGEVHSGRGYQSHYGMRLHFGLDQRNRIDRIEVRWIGGDVDVFKGIAVDQIVVLREGDA